MFLNIISHFYFKIMMIRYISQKILFCYSGKLVKIVLKIISVININFLHIGGPCSMN